jgi:MFS family permease
LVWGGIISFIGCSLFFFQESAALLFIGRALGGAAFGIYSMGLFSHQGMEVSEKRRGAMFALLVVGSILPVGAVAPFGEWLLMNSRYTLYLAVGPALSLLCSFFGARVNITASRSAPAEQNWGTYGQLFLSRSFLFLIMTGTVIALVDALTITMSLLSAERGLVLSYFLVGVAVTALIVRLPGAALLNRLPRRLLLAPCGILMACAMILVSLMPTNNALIVGGILFGMGLGAGWPMYHAMIGDLLAPMLRPKGTATALFLYDIGFFVTPLAIGYFLPRFGTTATFAGIAIAAGIALVLLEAFYWLPVYGKSRIKN